MSGIEEVEAGIAIAGLIYGYTSSRRSAKDMASGQPRIANVTVQSSAYGGPVPIVYGRTRISGNLIWFGNFKANATQSSVSGKGGGASDTTYNYKASFAMALGMGVISNIGALWRNTKKFFGVFVPSLQKTVTEYVTVPSTGPHTVNVSDDVTRAFSDSGTAIIWNAASQKIATLVLGTGYTYAGGTYTFSDIRAWAAGNNVQISYTNKSGAAQNALLTNVTLFTGTNSQLPWTEPASGQQLNYRNIAYIGATGYPLSSSAAIENHSFEVDAIQQVGAAAGLTSQTFDAFNIQDNFDDAGQKRTYTTSLTPLGNLKFGMAVKLTTTGTLPVGLATGVIYYVVNIFPSANGGLGTFSLTPAMGIQADQIKITGNGTGITTATQYLVDASPSDVVNDILTNVLYGAGFPSANLGSLTNFKNYSLAANLLVSPQYSAQKSAVEIVNQLCTIGNTAPFFSEGLLKFVPLADSAVTGNGVTYTPSLTVQYALTDDDFLEDGSSDPLVCDRKTQADAWNHVQVKYLNRNNDYIEEVVEAKDQAAIDTYGLRTMPAFNLPEVCLQDTARAFAQLVLQRVLYLRNQWTFRLGVKYSLLEPGDIVTLTDSGLGLSQYPVRVISTEEQADDSIQIVAEDLPATVGTTPAYPSQVSAGVTFDAAVDPLPAFQPMIIDAPSTLLQPGGGFQVWLAAAGGPNYGGADIWVSSDNATYTLAGRVYGKARYGYLTATLADSADPDNTNTCAVDLTISNGTLLGTTQVSADALETLCWVDGELIAYRDATLTSTYHYNLAGTLHRGVYGTTHASHPSGVQFMRVDSSVFKYEYDPARVGQRVYFKITPFNLNGNREQALSDATPYSYVLRGKLGAPNAPTSLTATAVADGVALAWSGPTAGVYAASFNVYRDSTLLKNVTAFAFRDAVVDGSSHAYTVRSVNFQGGESGDSNTATVAAKVTQAGTNMNLVQKFVFDDSSLGLWGGTIALSTITGQPFAKAMQLTDTDAYEGINLPSGIGMFAVIPGEKIFVNFAGNTQGSAHTGVVGLQCFDAAGSPTWVVGGSLASGQNWTSVGGTLTVPNGMVSARVWVSTSAPFSGGQVFKVTELYVGRIAQAADVTSAVYPTLDAVPDGPTYNKVSGQPSDAIVWTGVGAGGGGNTYDYRGFSTASYAVVSGDNLEFDYFGDIDNPTNTAGVDLQCSDTTVLRTANPVDQNGIGQLNDTTAWSAGKWYHRKLSLASLVGKTVNSWAIFNESDTAGTYLFKCANIKITNGATLKKSGFSNAQINGNKRNLTVWAGAGSTGYSAVKTYAQHLSSSAVDLDDHVADGGTFYRIAIGEIDTGTHKHKLSVAGSGAQMGDMRNAFALRNANLGSKFDPATLTITSPWGSGNPHAITFDVANGAVLLMGGGANNITYGHMTNNALTQANSTTVTYYLYVDDPTFAGGTPALGVTITPENLYGNVGRIYIGSINITTGNTASTGGGTGAGGGGGSCVAVDSVTPDGQVYGDIKEGAWLELACPRTFARSHGRVQRASITDQLCVRLVTENECALTASFSAPIATDQGIRFASSLKVGDRVATLVDGRAGWSALAMVDVLGTRAVWAGYLNDRCHWAGEVAGRSILHHNKLIP